MGEDGKPRPPRRVPRGAAPLAQLPPRPPQPAPRRQPWRFGRFLAGFVVFLLVVAGGASAGWWVRAESLRMDPAKVLESISPGVIRVLATTCAGTGEATGVLIDDGLILTAASAVKQPLAIAFMTPDGRVRRANLLGSSADGVAVLRLIGRLDSSPVPLATAEPDPLAERAQIGYTADGKQAIQPIGTAEQPRGLSEIMNPAKLGGPVVDKSGHVIGLVVGNTVPAAEVVPLAKLREYAEVRPPAITPEESGTCQRSRGPQIPMAPELQVGSTELGLEVQKLFANYLTQQNKHDFAAVRRYYSKKLARALPEEKDAENHETTFLFNAKIISLARAPEGLSVRMTFAVLFSPTSQGAGGQTCNRLDLRYRVVRERGQLKIDSATTQVEAQSCDTE